MKKKRYTMKDVAAKAGVTQPTVSHVINGTASISKEVCDRVNKVIKELGYRPNALAKGLKTNKTNIIGLIVPDITNGYYSHVAKQVEKRLTEAGYAYFLAYTSYNEKVEEDCVENFLQYNVDGIIIAYQFKNRKVIERLSKINKPFVVIEDEINDCPACKVDTDNEFGGYCATKHLIERGKKRIAFLSDSLKIKCVLDRYEGYTKALKEAGIEYDPSIVMSVDESADKFSAGLYLGEKISEKDIDGIFVTSDEVAFGVMRVFANKKKNIPKDVAIVGYDDIPMAQLITPALTTVSQPINSMIKNAIEFLLKIMEEDCELPALRLKPEIVIRETT